MNRSCSVLRGCRAAVSLAASLANMLLKVKRALAPATGWLYTAVALLAGAWFLVMAHQLYAGVRRGESVKPLRLFLQSNNYLAAVFCALAVDSALDLPTLFSLR